MASEAECDTVVARIQGMESRVMVILEQKDQEIIRLTKELHIANDLLTLGRQREMASEIELLRAEHASHHGYCSVYPAPAGANSALGGAA